MAHELDRRLDALGLGVASAAAIWVAVTGMHTGGRSLPLAVLLFASGATAVAAKRAPRGWIVPILVLLSIAPLIIALIAGRSLVGSGPQSGPLGYSNASGALFFISAGAALVVGRLASRPAVRFGAYSLWAAWILISWWSEAVAAALLGSALPFTVLILHRPSSTRVAVIGGAGLVLTALLFTSAAGLAYRGPGYDGPVNRLVGATGAERRVALWSDAVDLVLSQPLTGVGPGQFGTHSPTARSDRDAQWAHNEYLEMAAETGVIGLLLLMGLVLWGFARLWTARHDSRVVPVVAVLAGVGLHANIDYVWHFPAVALGLAALVGAGAAMAQPTGVMSPTWDEAVSRRSRIHTRWQ